MAAGLAVAAAGRWSELVQFAREYVKPTDAVAAVLLIAAAWTTKCAMFPSHDVLSSTADQGSCLNSSVALPKLAVAGLQRHPLPAELLDNFHRLGRKVCRSAADVRTRLDNIVEALRGRTCWSFTCNRLAGLMPPHVT